MFLYSFIRNKKRSSYSFIDTYSLLKVSNENISVMLYTNLYYIWGLIIDLVTII